MKKIAVPPPRKVVRTSDGGRSAMAMSNATTRAALTHVHRIVCVVIKKRGCGGGEKLKHDDMAAVAASTLKRLCQGSQY